MTAALTARAAGLGGGIWIPGATAQVQGGYRPSNVGHLDEAGETSPVDRKEGEVV